ncbi:PucR family transcriptional regulator [Nonomuraea cavernae]|uniref:Transcriptional regulator n=1 Tax=Nonomuraea cavernae TaxID=2045107 RepID=A0A917Z0Y3_9ACTN|nr:PucR family transcriptional regulator [Nonomuraea cavernae]MCA2187605.1 helix-turn-helix domain-containing protein [Nonomuraea cavernae]GGO71061.1 transcriptional regulator [Nonomuraea cavernae]
MADLQRTVDELAARLDRPLLLEDHLQRVIAYSEQSGAMDDIRRDSILRRHTTPEVRLWLRAAGIDGAALPLRTPGAPHLGLLPRVCVPVRHEAGLLGFLWFIDAEPAMPDAQVAEAAAAAPALALALYHESLAIGLASHRELEAVTGLLLGERDAARQLIEAGAFPQAQPVTVLVARPLAPEPDEALRLALEQGLLALRRRLSGHHPLHLVRYDHAVLLTAGPAVSPDELHGAMSVPVTVGVGRPRPALTAAAASYTEARHAAEVAARVPGLGRSLEWSRLGVYRMLTHLSPYELHPGLEPLLADEHHLPLLETLETYLDLAGSAVATSRALRLHRTSLYYRLRRVEELARTDLKDGGERLALHLSLKLARLSGRYLPRDSRPVTPT